MSSSSTPAQAMLAVSGLEAGYGPVEVLHGLDFYINDGEIVVILGANGAGKTTTLRAISGMISTKGSVVLDGDEIRGKSGADIVRRGVAHVPQGRGTFPELSVTDNLLAGAYIRKDSGGVKEDVDRWFSLFPRLKERESQLAGSLSGGEQQMLAVARALMSRPRVLLLDEPSLGLAPLIIEDLFRTFETLNRDDGITMLIVEQNAQLALNVGSRAYVLEAGSIVLSGSADELRDDESVRKAYLGGL